VELMMNKLTLSSVALETYRKEAKQFSNLDRDILELKLTAIANNSEQLGIVDNKRVYKFCGLIMLINEKHKRIETLTWRNDLHKSCMVTKETAIKLKQDYNKLGLSKSGNSYIK
jgi:hypothetical protein